MRPWLFLSNRSTLRSTGSVGAFAVVLSISVGSILSEGIAIAAEESVSFGAHIRPILADKCVRCHGPDEATRQADLRLDQAAGIRHAFAGGDFGKSDAWTRLNSADDQVRMPPPDSGKALSDDDRAKLTAWMERGANWEPHWAYVAPRANQDSVNLESRGDGIRNEIDVFVSARLKSEGTTLSPEADKTTLIRRLSLDLTGLPPTPAQVDEFVNDKSTKAYEALVERLLASSHYGERMALDWLDGARFADTNGYQGDFARSMWPWRDWVINAFNSNMPFDQFVIEQVAGDLLPNPTIAQQTATGFNRNHRTVTEDGSIDEEWRVENVVDRVETTTGVFLGLTFGCARCHDHKYDPITQREFYEFYAFFNSVDEKGVYLEQPGNSPPLIQTPSEEDRVRLATINDQIHTAEKQLQHASHDLQAEIADWLQQESDRAASSIEDKSPIFRFSSFADLARLRADSESLTGLSEKRLPHRTAMLKGDAFRFTGTESIELGETLVPDSRVPFALAAWIKPRMKGETDIGAVVSTLDDSEYRGFDVLVEEGGKLSVQLVNRWPVDALKVITKNPLPHDAWSYVVVSWNGSSKAEGVSVFVNGDLWPVEVEADTLVGTIKSGLPLHLGSRATNRYFLGDLANVKIFDRALTASEADVSLRNALRSVLEEFSSTDPEQREELDHLASLLPGTKRREQARKIEELSLKRESLIESIPTVMVMKDLATPRTTYLLKRGQYNTPDESEALNPDVPDFLPPLPENAQRDRLSLARWIVSPQNPLTARVISNRIWQRLFGQGLVRTSENFGVQADPPSHPELLDWLATSLVRSGWDLKQLQRTIVTSAAYRQSSSAPPSSYARDPENRLLSRGPRFRLPAELIRDNALAISGLLSLRIGGPSVLPYQPEGLWNDLAGGYQPPYVQSHGDDLYRRSLYTYRKRTVSHPTLNSFDAPSWEVCALKRPTTNTPMQALALLNDVTYLEAARKLAERMIVDGGPTLASRIRHGFRLATSRTPNGAEMRSLSEAFDRYLTEFRADPSSADKLLSAGESPTVVQADHVELAAYSTLADVLLNLDETIVKE